VPHDSAFASQARAQDTLRWGGRTNVSWGPQSSVGGNSLGNLQTALNNANGNLGKQLVNAHWRWPLAWQTLIVIRPFFAADETGSVVVRIDWTVGSGDAQETFSTYYTVAPDPVTGIYEDVIDTTVPLPACDVMVQVGAFLFVTGEGKTLSTASVDTLEVAVFVAPTTEPHAALHLLDLLDEQDKTGRREGGWMGPGFHEEPLEYRR